MISPVLPDCGHCHCWIISEHCFGQCNGGSSICCWLNCTLCWRPGVSQGLSAACFSMLSLLGPGSIRFLPLNGFPQSLLSSNWMLHCHKSMNEYQVYHTTTQYTWPSRTFVLSSKNGDMEAWYTPIVSALRSLRQKDHEFLLLARHFLIKISKQKGPLVPSLKRPH